MANNKEGTPQANQNGSKAVVYKCNIQLVNKEKETK